MAALEQSKRIGENRLGIKGISNESNNQNGKVIRSFWTDETLGYSGTVALAEALKTNTTITELDLWSMDIWVFIGKKKT